MVAKTVPVDPFDLIVFGGTGDLARRKLFPALFHRFMAGQLPEDALIIGAARGKMTRKAFQAHTVEALEEFVAKDDRPADRVAKFVAMVDYATVDAMSDQGWDILQKQLKDREDRPPGVLPLRRASFLWADLRQAGRRQAGHAPHKACG